MAEEQYIPLVDILLWDSLKTAVARYGIEGTEQKINELYKLMPTIREKMLDMYNKMYKGKK